MNGESALIVTNSPFGGLFLRERLAELGFVVSCVPDEASAFEVLREKTPALAIVDCALGEQATHRLIVEARKSGARSNLVLFSPFERTGVGRGVAQGLRGRPVKPVRLKSLHRRLVSREAPLSPLQIRPMRPRSRVPSPAAGSVGGR